MGQHRQPQRRRPTDKPQLLRRILNILHDSSQSPSNIRLIQFLDAWAKDKSKETYAAVRTELQQGHSFLMLPSGEQPATGPGWQRTAKTTRLQPASIYTIENKKVLGAFTDPDAVLRWSKGKLTPCVSLESQAVMEICEKNGIQKIIINSGSENVYPLSFVLNDEIEEGEVYW